MQISQILREKGRDVVTIMAYATLSEATRLLARRRIGAVVVRGEDGRLAGVLSERDVVRALSEESVTALARPVSAWMTSNVVTCSETDLVDELMEVMTHQRVRHIPVVEDGELCGIISIGDVVKSRIEETVREAASLREYITAS